MSIQTMLFQFIGGLGIFLFGINLMGDGLKGAAGDSLRDLLQRFTSTPFKAVLTGIVVTALIQSSGGTTVLAVGLVSSGFMTLNQAIGVVMGANIGTTVTSFIIGFDLGAYALPIIGLGSIFMFFTRKPFASYLGQIVVGLGMLFYGLDLMGSGMAPLQEFESFHRLMATLAGNPLLGIGVGVVLTVVMQSSSATIGILQQLYMQGNVTLAMALPVLFGDNIGSTITAIIASIGGNVAAKRTAGAHVMFNLIGTVLFTILLQPFTSLIMFLSTRLGLNPAMQIAFSHGLFNVFNLLVQFWFIDWIAAFLTKVIRDDEPEEEAYDDTQLDLQILTRGGSTLALHQAHRELIQLAKMVSESFDKAEEYYHKKDHSLYDQVYELEELINRSDSRLMTYLGNIAEYPLGPNDSEVLTAMIDTSKYLERIGDHAVIIVNNLEDAVEIEDRRKKQGTASTSGRKMLWGDEKLSEMFAEVRANVHDIVELIETGDRSLAPIVMVRDKEINQVEQELRDQYIELIRSGESRPVDNILFIDIVSNLERIGDHTRKLVINHLKYLHHYSTEDIEEYDAALAAE